MNNRVIVNSKKSLVAIAVALLFLLITVGVYKITKVSDGVIKPTLTVVPDDGIQTPSQVFEKINKAGKIIPNGFFNPGFSQTAWWIYVATKDYSNDYLQIINPHINTVSIYTVQQNKVALAYESGDYFPFKKRQLADPDFWFKIPTNQDGLLIKVNKSGESIIVPIQIVPEQTMPIQLASQNAVYGFFAGWLLFLVMFNLFLWVSLKDNIHFFYILYITMSALWLISNWGIAFQYLWPNQMAFSNKSRPIFACLSILFILELTKRFFTSPNEKPIYKNWVLGLQLLLAVLSGCILFANIPMLKSEVRAIFLTLTNIIWLASLFLVVFYIYKSYKKFKNLAIFFVMAISALFFFTVLNIIAQFNVQANWVNFTNKFGSAIGILAESTILSFGLSRRYDFYKQEKEAATLALETEKSLLADKLIQAQEEERSRLARELHDGLGGQLGGIRIGAFHKLKQSAQTQSWLDKQLEEAINDLRNITHDLMPVNLIEKGLVAILEKTVARWNASNDFVIQLDCSVQQRYPINVEVSIYRIANELLYNAKKHASATAVFISLWEDHKTNTITLMVEDNGGGFNPNKTDGIGWKNIRHRVQYLGGHISIDSNNNGSTIIIEFVLPSNRT